MIAFLLALVVGTGGATIERTGFQYERPVPKAKGLVALQLDADVLAHADESLGDIRIVNGKSEQVPYIVEPLSKPLIVPIAIPPRSASRPGSSIYVLSMPYESLPRNTTMVLTTSSRVFERRVSLRAPLDERHGREPRVLTSADWFGTDPKATALPLRFDLSCCGERTLELLVDEGDNAPLPIASAELRIPASELRFYHPGTPLTLLYGNRNLVPPRYDLAMLAKQIAAEKAQVLELTAPPRATAATKHDGASSTKWFWAALLVAVAALLALLARLISAR